MKSNEQEAKTKEKTEATVPEKELAELKIIAQRVGCDFGMDVRLGDPNGGSFFDQEKVSITLDPVQVARDPSSARHIAGHEGGHRAITRTARQIGIDRAQIRELYSQVGFAYLHNVIEDPAVDSWVMLRYPGLEPHVRRSNEKTLRSKHSLAITPEAVRVIKAIGYIPGFVAYGLEVIRDWFLGEVAEDIDPHVRKTLDETLADVRLSIQHVPDPEQRDQRDIISAARDRFKINTERVWPEFRKLVERDVNNESIRKMLDKLLRLVYKLLEKQQELQEARNAGDLELQEKLEKEIEKIEEKIDAFGPVSLRIEALELAGGGSGAGAGSGSPVPFGELSDKARSALEKLFGLLPDSMKSEFRTRATRQLEKLEDAINSDLAGKLTPPSTRPPSHGERCEEEKLERKLAKERGKRARKEKRIEERLHKQRSSGFTDYDKAYFEVADLVGALYRKLSRFLIPKRSCRWRKGFDSGQRIDLFSVMQAESDPTYLRRLWERKTVPTKYDYRFCLLVDLSGSMQGGNLEETFKGVVLLAEVLSQLEIMFEVRGFSNQSRVFKGWDRRLDREARNELAVMKKWGRGGTETAEATTSAVDDFPSSPGSFKFLVTLTDGRAYSPHDLAEVLARVRQEGRVRTVGIGLGPHTSYVEKLYRASLCLPSLTSRPDGGGREGNGFVESFGALLEDMIVSPAKY